MQRCSLDSAIKTPDSRAMSPAGSSHDPSSGDWFEGPLGGAGGAKEGPGAMGPQAAGPGQPAPVAGPARPAIPGGNGALDSAALGSSGEGQLKALLTPATLVGRMSAEWLRTALAQSASSLAFIERHRSDPLLELEARCQGYLADLALLIHPERLAERWLALLAVRGRMWTPREPLAHLIERCLRDAADQLAHEDALEESQQIPPASEFAEDYDLAAELFGVAEPFRRLVLLRFNRLPKAVRKQLFAWVARGIEPPSSPPSGASDHSAAGHGAAKSRANSGKGPGAGPNSGFGLTLDEARRILGQILTLPRGDER